MTVRAIDTRRIAAYAAVLLLIGLIMAAGCSSDVTDPTFPETPENPVRTAFLGVWGSGPDNVWIVGQPGLIYYWDGDIWVDQTSPTSQPLTSVWGDDTGTLYITGHNGVILRNTGGGWTKMESGTTEDLFDINSYQGTIMACGLNSMIRQFSGGSWSAAPTEVFIRDAEQAVTDTLYLEDIEDDNRIESLTTVAYYGLAGAGGSILMEDPETAWQLRRVTGGNDWVTCGSSAQRVPGNFIATDGGRLFQLGEADSRLVWNERPSPARGTRVYGIYVDDADTVWSATEDGRVIRVEPGNGLPVPLYSDDLTFYDIWGTSGTNLYAVGIDGRVMHFHEVAAGDHQWMREILPDLPENKSLGNDRFGEPAPDKFGRPTP